MIWIRDEGRALIWGFVKHQATCSEGKWWILAAFWNFIGLIICDLLLSHICLSLWFRSVLLFLQSLMFFWLKWPLCVFPTSRIIKNLFLQVRPTYWKLSNHCHCYNSNASPWRLFFSSKLSPWLLQMKLQFRLFSACIGKISLSEETNKCPPPKKSDIKSWTLDLTRNKS